MKKPLTPERHKSKGAAVSFKFSWDYQHNVLMKFHLAGLSTPLWKGAAKSAYFIRNHFRN